MLALIKPQFELGRGRVGKGGVVRDGADRREALSSVGVVAPASARRCWAFTPPGCRTQGQSRDVHSARRARPSRRRQRRDRPRADGAGGGALSAITVLTHGRPQQTPPRSNSSLPGGAARRDAALRRGRDGAARPQAGEGIMLDAPSERRRQAVHRARWRRDDPARTARYACTGVPVFPINFGEVGLPGDGPKPRSSRRASGAPSRATSSCCACPAIVLEVEGRGPERAINDVAIHRKAGERVAELA